MTSFKQSREGVMQEDPLAIITYAIGILPLIKNIKTDFHDITETWYADYTGSLGMSARVKEYFHLLERHDPGQRYYPQTFKKRSDRASVKSKSWKTVWLASWI